MRVRPLLIALCVAATAPALAQGTAGGVAEMNRELQEVWTRLSPVLIAQGQARARAELAAVRHATGRLEVSVRSVRRVAAGLQAAPGFLAITDRRVELAAPGQGSWWLEAEAEVRVKVRLGFLRPTFDIPLALRVEQLRLHSGVREAIRQRGGDARQGDPGDRPAAPLLDG